MVFPYFGKPPQFHRELLHKITRGVFENRVPTDQENQIYDIEDAIKWEQMVIEIERQRKEEEELRKTHKTSKTVTTTVTQVPSDSTQASDNQNFDFTQISQIRPTDRPTTPIPFSPVMPTDVYTSGLDSTISPNTRSQPLIQTQVFEGTQQSSSGTTGSQQYLTPEGVNNEMINDFRGLFNSSPNDQSLDFSGFSPQRITNPDITYARNQSTTRGRLSRPPKRLIEVI